MARIKKYRQNVVKPPKVHQPTIHKVPELKITQSRIFTPCELEISSEVYSSRDWYIWWKHHDINCHACGEEVERLNKVRRTS